MDLNTTLKGGQLAGRRKLVLAVVAAVGALGAYLVGDMSLTDAARELLPVLLGQ